MRHQNGYETSYSFLVMNCIQKFGDELHSKTLYAQNGIKCSLLAESCLHLVFLGNPRNFLFSARQVFGQVDDAFQDITWFFGQGFMRQWHIARATEFSVDFDIYFNQTPLFSTAQNLPQ